MIKKLSTTSQPINEILASRWSPRAFDINKIVTRQQIISLCEAARWAPSCNGDEPWRYIVLDKEHDRASYDKGFACLGKWNQKWNANVQVLFIACADTKFRDGKDNRWGMYDTGAASENICLQAVSLGLMAHQMGGFDENLFRTEFSIPEQYQIMAFIAVGYQAEDNILDKTFQEKELAARTRKELNSNFFAGSWNNPII